MSKQSLVGNKSLGWDSGFILLYLLYQQVGHNYHSKQFQRVPEKVYSIKKTLSLYPNGYNYIWGAHDIIP